MVSTSFSSRNATADRRADYARMLAASGDPQAAAELMEQALELAPGWTAGWFQLGEYHEKAMAPDAAIAAYRHVAGLDGQDIFGATLKLALLGAEAVPGTPPSRYVESLFDDYADRFETSLIEKLDYSVPRKLAHMISGIVREPEKFRCTVDLGCGTGLFGVEIAGRSCRLEGFDLSLNMLGKAAEKRIYDHLAQADLSLEPAACGLFADGFGRGRADLVAAADVMMYLGSLDRVFMLARSLCEPGGLFAFSVEDAGLVEGVRLLASRRYAHSQSYVETALTAAGFSLLDSLKTVIRKDGGNDIHGILFIARKPA